MSSLVEWFRHGPAGARVDEVEAVPEEPAGEVGFQVR